MSHRRIVILGGFGFGNLGDDLILRSALLELRRTLKDAEIAVLSNNPHETRERHAEITIFSPEALFRQIILRVLSRISNSYRKYVLQIPPDSFRRLLVSIRDADLVVSLGGGYLNDYSKFLTHSRLCELIFFGLCHKRLVLIGHEIGPLRRITLRLMARLAFKFAAYVTVRDERSLQTLSGLGLPSEKFSVTADESWAYEPRAARESGLDVIVQGEPVFAVNLMPFEVLTNVPSVTGIGDVDAERANERMLSGLASWLSSQTVKPQRIVFLSMSAGDAKLASRLEETLERRIPVEIISDLDSQYRALGRSQVVLSMRMHPIIMAAQMKVPAIAIATLAKIDATMKELGLADYVVPAIFDAQRTQDAFDRALKNKRRIRAVIEESIEGLRRRARLNTGVVYKLITGRIS
mgnify:FL=1